MDIIKRIVGVILLLSLAVHANATRIWMEAESGAEYFPMLAGSDLSASDHTFLVSGIYADYNTRSNDDGRVTFEIYIPNDGTYKLWGRIRTDNSGDQPYDISIGNGDTSDNSQWQSWAPYYRSSHIGGNEIWQWHYSGFSKYFSKGTHKIRLIQRSGGHKTHIDKILLTDESGYTPSGDGGIESTPDISNPYKSHAVSTHGKLRVSGNQMVNQAGNAVQLKGISLHGLQWFPIAKEQTIPFMAEHFGIELVRLAMYVEGYDPTNPDIMWGGYMVNKDKLKARVESAVQDAVKAGVYVLIDWHIHDVPQKYTQEAGDFFEEMAEKFGHHPNVIYEIANEPVGTTWHHGIKPYAETIISRIRQHDPDNIILVGTPNWSQDVDTASQDPLSGSNIMYSFHYYAGTHGLSWAKNKINTALSNGAAIMVSEWGSSDVGTSTSNYGRAEDWINYMNSKQLSWINWSLGTKDEKSSILKPEAPISGPWVDGDLTTAGNFIKPYFNAPQSDNGGSAGDAPPTGGNGGTISDKVSANWDNDAAAPGEYRKDVAASYVSGKIKLDINGGDPYVHWTETSNVDNYDKLEIRVRNGSTNGKTDFKVFFNIDGIWKSQSFTVHDTDTWQTKIIDMSGNAYWKGNLSKLRIDGPGSGAGTFRLDHVILKANGSSSEQSNCLNYDSTSLKELSFPSSSGGCINVAGGLDGKDIAIADSDIHTSCNLRGTATGSNGGSLSVSSDWKTSTSLKGNTLNISVSNGCEHFKLRIR